MKGCLKRVAQALGVIALLVVVVVVIALATAPGGGGAPSPAVGVTATSAAPATIAPAPTVAWYAGGTLHSATVGEWKAADERNRLATSADWAAKAWDSVADLERNARSLMACVDEATTAAGDASTVTDLAAACAVLLKAQ